VIGAVPERASPFDVLVMRERALPAGGVVGTGSIRRRAQVAVLWPEVRVVDVRGNVDTRLGKLAAGDVDGLILAAAGLARLGINVPNARTFAADEMLPAPGQGALAVQVRSDDERTLELVKHIDDRGSRLALEAERALMAALGGGCDLPLGALAQADADGTGGVALMAAVIDPGGARIARAEARARTAVEVGRKVAELLRQGGAEDILAAIADEPGRRA
jgi:hydroxymethylbilane synthase